MGKQEASGVRNWRQNDGPTSLCYGSLDEVLNLSFFLCRMGTFMNLPGRVVLMIKGVITNQILRRGLNSTQESLVTFFLLWGTILVAW